MGLCHTQVYWTQSTFPCSKSTSDSYLLRRHSNTVLSQSLWGLGPGVHKVCFRPLENLNLITNIRVTHGSYKSCLISMNFLLPLWPHFWLSAFIHSLQALWPPDRATVPTCPLPGALMIQVSHNFLPEALLTTSILNCNFPLLCPLCLLRALLFSMT